MRRTPADRYGDDARNGNSDNQKEQARTSGNHALHLIPLIYDSVYAEPGATI